MSTVTVLSPQPPVDRSTINPGPLFGNLAGMTVGVRRDEIWAPWDVISDVWIDRLRKDGAEVRTWVAGGRTGDDGLTTKQQLQEFVDICDLAIVGLGN